MSRLKFNYLLAAPGIIIEIMPAHDKNIEDSQCALLMTIVLLLINNLKGRD